MTNYRKWAGINIIKRYHDENPAHHWLKWIFKSTGRITDDDLFRKNHNVGRMQYGAAVMSQIHPSYNRPNSLRIDPRQSASIYYKPTHSMNTPGNRHIHVLNTYQIPNYPYMYVPPGPIHRLNPSALNKRPIVADYYDVYTYSVESVPTQQSNTLYPSNANVNGVPSSSGQHVKLHSPHTLYDKSLNSYIHDDNGMYYERVYFMYTTCMTQSIVLTRYLH